VNDEQSLRTLYYSYYWDMGQVHLCLQSMCSVCGHFNGGVGGHWLNYWDGCVGTDNLTKISAPQSCKLSVGLIS